VEDNAQRMPLAGTEAAYAMTHIHPVEPFCAVDWPVMNWKDHAISLIEGYNFGTRLHTRTLLGENEFASGKVTLRGR
jgi:hypothetical protein